MMIRNVCSNCGSAETSTCPFEGNHIIECQYCGFRETRPIGKKADRKFWGRAKKCLIKSLRAVTRSTSNGKTTGNWWDGQPRSQKQERASGTE